MTTIECGGGPSIQQRRDFSGHKDGTQVPGYLGYIPQLKYRVGGTYGTDTYELAKTYEHRHPLIPVEHGAKPPLTNYLPKSTGDNKLTETMVPGYTGFVPRKLFKYGGTYREDCDYSIDEFLTNKTHQNAKLADIRATSYRTPLPPRRFDPEVKEQLRLYRDLVRPRDQVLLEGKRALTEAPIPGYKGYIPKIGVTEHGLGKRYHETTKSGLNDFAHEVQYNKAAKSAPLTMERSPVGAGEKPLYTKRLYLQDGMIPKYTGYLPQRRFAFGNTYGDTSRSLEVCAHDQTSFGDYMKTLPRRVRASAVY